METELDIRQQVTALHKNDGRRMIVFAILIMIVVSVFQLKNHDGTVSAQLGEEFLGVGGVEDSVFVYYKDIESVELVSDLIRGSSLSGTEGTNVWNGTYQNAEYGAYQLYAYAKPGLYIVIHHADGILVFNDYNEGKTKEMYSELCEKVKTA